MNLAMPEVTNNKYVVLPYGLPQHVLTIFEKHLGFELLWCAHRIL